MRFQKNHKFGFTTDKDKPLTASVCLRVDEELAAKLKSIPNWQQHLRDAASKLVEKIECD
ncbi:hypothetical protein NIES4071_26360 [Calothrix sp. NIES-4071]|nr:hypothetical protein NIES4071_26360 [Calothrix sp. NIES-4071]BAZ56958.1 hypothetical protein NIES4105_26300 [Calothrix sp. NIES-4105]